MSSARQQGRDTRKPLHLNKVAMSQIFRDTIGRFSAIDTKETIYDLHFAFLHIKLLLERQLFTFSVDPFSKGKQKNFGGVSLPESGSISFKRWVLCCWTLASFMKSPVTEWLALLASDHEIPGSNHTRNSAHDCTALSWTELFIITLPSTRYAFFFVW